MQVQKQAQKAVTTQLKLSQIIKLILQFLQQNNFPQSFKTLQQQSKMALNIVNLATLQTLILQSKWQSVFKQLTYITLSEQTLFDLYQLIIDDLIDRDAFEAAAYVLKQCVLAESALLPENREKILRIQYICENRQQKAMYHKPPTLTRRENIISRILKQTHHQVERSRLLTLITSALKHESSQGLIVPNLSYSILQGKANKIDTQLQQMISKVDKIIRYTEQTRITCIAMSNSGNYIALGGIDGLIELYEPVTYTLDTSSLKYQAEGIMLYHENSVSHMVFNETDQMLATADTKNIIKVWSMESGRVLRKLEHTTTIGCCCWGLDSSQLLLGYQNVQMYGIRGCNLLKEYLCGDAGSGEYLLSVVVSASDVHGGRVFAFGQLGTVRAFNYKTQQQTGILRVNGHAQQHGQLIKVVPKLTKQRSYDFHLCLSKFIITLNQKLQQLHKYQITGSGDRIELVNVVFSNFYTYECVKKQNGKHVLQVRDQATSRIVQGKEIEAGVIEMEIHCFRNLLVMYGRDNVLSFWRP